MLTFGSLFAGIGGFDLGYHQAGMRCAWQVEIDPAARSVLAHHWPETPRLADVRDCGAHNLAPVDVMSFGFPCQDLSVAGNRAGLAHALASFTKQRGSPMNYDLCSSLGRMFPDCSLAIAAETSQQSSWNWSASGMSADGQLLMLSGLVLHSADSAYSVCSLAQILEPQCAPKYYLSPRACQGILRRAEKHGRTLPEALQLALATMAALAPVVTDQTTS